MAERVAYANKLLVLHPRFREAVALLERCHQSSKQAGEPVCGAILGSSGVGKTSVVDHYRRLHPPRETETANCQPVLKVTLQPVWKKGSGVICRNGPAGALHRRLLTPFSKRSRFAPGPG